MSRHILEELRRQGHTAVVIGAVGKNTATWLEEQRFDREEAASGCDGALVVTGTSNPLYRGFADCYRYLSELPRGAPFAYAQWDVALPFGYRPELNPALKKAGCASPLDLTSTLLCQPPEAQTRALFGGGKFYDYARYPFGYERCCFELFERLNDQLPVVEASGPELVYFGSDRPGRVAEMRRWFGLAKVPVKVFGKWGNASMAAFAGTRVAFESPVSEGLVNGLLNRTAATLYITDEKYARADYMTLRFFENASAGVPVFYSDRIQPQVRRHPEFEELVVHDAEELKERVARASGVDRVRYVELNRSLVAKVAAGLAEQDPGRVLRRVFAG